MNYQYEVTISQDKFKSIPYLRDLLACIEPIPYSSCGSFLSALLFKRNFQNSFDVLVEDETLVYDAVKGMCDIDRKKGTMTFSDVDGILLMKIKIYDSISKYSDIRKYVLENTSTEPGFITSTNNDVDKLILKIPKRGTALMQMFIELDENDDQMIVEIMEKTVWSLSKIGVATLLRDIRFMPQALIDIAADKIEDMMVEHANKTVSLMRMHGTVLFKTITSSELKKFGKPFAALLKA